MARPQNAPVQRSNAAIGLTIFASIVLMIAGFAQVIMGFVALFNDEFFVVGAEYVFSFDLTTWGWIHVILGALVFAAGFSLYAGAVWARTIGVIVAVLAILANILWLPYYPVWSLLIITLCFYVIWALTTHGRDITQVSD